MTDQPRERTMSADIERLRQAIRNVPDFPQPGIQFKDITPLLADPQLFELSVDLMTAPYQQGDIDAVVGIDARGFIFAAAAASKLSAGFVPVRKKGKLPYQTIEKSYDLEYGSNTVAMHVDAVPSGARVLLLDDLLATGGTAAAAIDIIYNRHAERGSETVHCSSPFLDLVQGQHDGLYSRLFNSN